MFLCVSTNQLTIPTYSFSLASVNMHQIKGKKIGKQLGSKSASRFLDPSDSLNPPRTYIRNKQPSRSLFPTFGEPISATSSIIRSSNDDGTITLSWGTNVQHGSQIISSESGTYNSVISCRFNPIWRTDRYDFFLGSAISTLELANRTPRPPGSMSINYAHGHHIAKFSKFLNGIPETGSAKLFPSPPHRSRSNNIVQQPSATQRVSSRPPSRGTRQSSNAQHHESTTISTALTRREMSVESRINAQVTAHFGQLQLQLQSQMASQMTSQFTSLMATMEALITGSRTGNAAQDKEDV